jgi:hypothetical protein
MKRAEPSSEPPAVFVVRNVLFSRASSRFDDRSKYTLTGTISDESVDTARHAAWTTVASAILNLDEVLTKE